MRNSEGKKQLQKIMSKEVAQLMSKVEKVRNQGKYAEYKNLIQSLNSVLQTMNELDLSYDTKEEENQSKLFLYAIENVKIGYTDIEIGDVLEVGYCETTVHKDDYGNTLKSYTCTNGIKIDEFLSKNFIEVEENTDLKMIRLINRYINMKIQGKTPKSILLIESPIRSTEMYNKLRKTDFIKKTKIKIIEQTKIVQINESLKYYGNPYADIHYEDLIILCDPYIFKDKFIEEGFVDKVLLLLDQSENYIPFDFDNFKIYK